MHNRQTIGSVIQFLLYLINFRFYSCHLKDMGEAHTNVTAFVDDLFENRILHGNDAALEEYPFNVQFFNFGGLCGGSILTRKIVLTAAHCFDYNTNVGEMKVVSNAVKLYNRHQRSGSEIHEVWDIAIHESYDSPQRYSNDVALIIIHDIFKFGPTVQKVALTRSSKWMSEDETGFVATGWGIMEMRKRQLQKTFLRYIPPRECSKMSGTPITKDMFCLYGDEKTDTCQGDSGGGIVWKNVLVGIVSHGDNCLKSPGAYANIYHFRFWIKKTARQLHLRFYQFHNIQKLNKNML